MKKQPTINPNDFVSVESGSEDVYIPLDEEIDVYDVDKAIDEVNGVVVAGSTEDKVEYLDETKTDIREAIVNQGVDVGEDAPFRLYAEKISEIEGEINNQDKTIIENGTYTADAGYTGLGEVVVEVPQIEPVLETLNVSGNGTYTPSGNVDGYDEVVVDVQPVLEDISVSENGTYTASSGYDGLGEVVVNTPVINNQDKNISQNGTYTADSGYSGLGEVSVNVQPVLEDKTIRVNGTYTAGEGYDGLGEVVVDVADIPAVVEPLSVSPTTSQQVITPPVNVDGFNQVTVGAVDSSIDSDIVSGNIKSGVSILGVSGSVIEANETTLNVSPTTSAQTFTPTGDYTGFDEVNVGAVDSSIDANIVSGNIKSGVSILGVSGSVVEVNNQNKTVSQNGVYVPDSGYTGLGEVTVNVPAPQPVLDTLSVTSNGTYTPPANVDGYNEVVVNVADVPAVIDPLSISPSTSQQIITAPSGVDGYSPITVDAVTSAIDSNIVAGNIKSGVSILGVSGSCVELNAESTTLTPTISATTVYPTSPYNALSSVTVEAVDSSIDSNIVAGNIKEGVTILGVTGTYKGIPPSDYYRLYEKDANGVLVNSRSTPFIPLPVGTKDLSAYCLAYEYYGTPSNVLSGVVNLSPLEKISGTYSAFFMFASCGGITSADLSSITSISGENACWTMFGWDSGLITADLSSLVEITGWNSCAQMFLVCSALANVDLSSLTEVSGSMACSSMFSNCTRLLTLFFPSLSSTGFGTRTNQFSNMLNRVDGCTVHFPSNLQSVIGSWSDVQNGFGGTNTTVLFDLPATVTLVGTNSYYRNPKYDTATALAWFDTSATRATPYYTSGTTDPVVNSAIYSDASCTTQVDTIASIS